MKTLHLIFMALPLACHAGVSCQTAWGDANGSWASAVAWDGNNRLTCNGANRPVQYVLTRGGLSNGASQAEIQAVFNDAWLGDKILFTAGDSFNIVLDTYGTWISNRPGTGTLEITTTEWAKLPPTGARITPAYKALMPIIHAGDYGLNFHGAGPVGVENVIVRGLYFEPRPDLSKTVAMNGGWVKFGNGPYNAVNANGVVNPPRSAYPTTTRGAAGVGTTTVVVNADLTAWRTGIKIFLPHPSECVSGTCNVPYDIPEYTITALNTSTPNQHSFEVSPALRYTYASGTRVHVSAVDVQSPNNIVLQHCVFHNPRQQWQVERFITTGGRNITVRDNWFSAPNAAISAGDSQVILGGGRGPMVYENNYLDGGTENYMNGGYYSTSNEATSTLVRYNFFGHLQERDFMWDWCVTQDEGCTSASSASTSPGVVKANAGVSVPGLAEFSPRLIFPGRHIHRFATGHRYKALNLGVVGTVEPAWATAVTVGQKIYDVDPLRTDSSVYGTTECNGPQPGDGVCWERTASFPFIKNNFELKRGKNYTIQYNVFDGYWPMRGINSNNQNYIFNLKASGLGEGTSCADGLPPPWCYRAETRNIMIANNIMRTAAGGVVLSGASGLNAGGVSQNSRNGGYTLRHNLIQLVGRPNYEKDAGYRMLTLNANATDSDTARTVPIDDIVVENNTFYSPWPYYSRSFGRGMAPISVGSGGGYEGERRFAGNILHRGTQGTFTVASSITPGNMTDFGITLKSHWVKTADGGQLGKNIILGAGNTVTGVNEPFPEDTVWTGCPNSLACIRSEADVPDWSSVFANPQAGDFTLRNDHWGKRAMPDGADLGADVSQLPEIRGLTITASDRSALFKWRVADPIVTTPCVVEVHTAPDLESPVWHGKPGRYVGELSRIGDFYGMDRDDNGRSLSSGVERMFMLGYAVPLEPATAYYYRLHCAGDVRRGSFQTRPALGDNDGIQTISRVPAHSDTHSLEVEYGPDYDRNAGTIAGSSIVVASCEADQPCSADIPTRPGSFVYYRWTERNEAGEPLESSGVSVFVGQ